MEICYGNLFSKSNLRIQQMIVKIKIHEQIVKFLIKKKKSKSMKFVKFFFVYRFLTKEKNMMINRTNSMLYKF